MLMNRAVMQAIVVRQLRSIVYPRDTPTSIPFELVMD